MEFRVGVDFHYPDGKEVLRNVSFTLERGKAYALVGPTGGGKTTTASLMARLYDRVPWSRFFLDGRDIRSWSPAERAQKVGFILQEPFLFSGTVRDNILYGNEEYSSHTSESLARILEHFHLADLISRFPEETRHPRRRQRKQHQSGAKATHRLHASDPAQTRYHADPGRSHRQYRHRYARNCSRKFSPGCPPAATKRGHHRAPAEYDR